MGISKLNGISKFFIKGDIGQMRWNYNDEYRDEFSKGPHRDILIVPHGTKVIPVAGGPPEITSRVPLFNDDGTPQTSGGNFVM